MEDEKIIALFFDRDEAAIAAVWDAYGGYCAQVARNLLDGEEDVEEVLSDTWLRAWETIPPNRPGNLKLYLARIARNVSFDRFRAQTRQKRGGGEAHLALEELAECVAAPGRPGDALEAEELRRAVNGFLGRLPQRERKVFLLRYFYLESSENIGNRLGIRPALVRTILSRTRKKLRTYLEKEGFL